MSLTFEQEPNVFDYLGISVGNIVQEAHQGKFVGHEGYNELQDDLDALEIGFDGNVISAMDEALRDAPEEVKRKAYSIATLLVRLAVRKQSTETLEELYALDS